MEHLPFFVGAIVRLACSLSTFPFLFSQPSPRSHSLSSSVYGQLFALHAQLPNSTINKVCASYIASRICYAASYNLIESHSLSWIRTVAWWPGNSICIWTLVQGGQAINARGSESMGLWNVERRFKLDHR